MAILRTHSQARCEAEGSASPIELSFDALYDAYFSDVCRWSRALGARDSELDDIAQEVFLVVTRQLPRFDGRNAPAWLYGITRRVMREVRRRAWFRRIVLGKELEAESTQTAEGPAEVLEREEAVRTVQRLLRPMSEKRRVVFTLFEIEGYTGEEIAELLRIPVATVWTRLFHARREFAGRLERLEVEP